MNVLPFKAGVVQAIQLPLLNKKKGSDLLCKHGELLSAHDQITRIALMCRPPLQCALRLPAPGLALGFRWVTCVGDRGEADGRLHVFLFQPPASGLYLTPAGVRIDSAVYELGDTGSVKLQAGLMFPPELGLNLRVGADPIKEWVKASRFRVDNLALKLKLP